MALNKSTLSEQIYQILRSDILHQRIPLGEKLTLKNLQKQFEVSSTPIREALTRLTEDGLVKYYSNIGVNVIELSRQDLTELYQFMGDLDRLAILYSGNSPRREEICKILEDNITHTLELEEKAQHASLSQEETDKWIGYSDHFHLIFYDYCENSRLTLAAEKLRSQLTIFSNAYETGSLPQTTIFRAHEEIFSLYKERHFQEAADRMRLHLEESLQFALEALDSIAG